MQNENVGLLFKKMTKNFKDGDNKALNQTWAIPGEGLCAKPAVVGDYQPHCHMARVSAFVVRGQNDLNF